jgi:DNA-binding NarL/FixJ family response regulator
VIRLIIVDDHILFREGLKSLMATLPDVTVVGEAEDGRGGIALAQESRPDLVLMDVSMPDMNGIEATRKIVSKSGDMRVMALSMHPDRQFVSQMLQAGARGYLLKSCAFDEVRHAIDTVVAGEIYVSPHLTGVVVKDYVDRMNRAHSSGGELTPREREVLQLVAEGKTNREVADALALGIKTAETHRKRIMEKLKLHTVAELTKYAVKEGITRL